MDSSTTRWVGGSYSYNAWLGIGGHWKSISAAASPCCFPLFSTLAGMLGLGSVPFLRSNAAILIQGMTALAVVGQIASYWRHRKRGPLVVSGVSAGLVGFGYFVNYRVWFIYAALSGLTIAAVWNLVISRRARSCCPKDKSRSSAGNQWQ